MLERQNGFIKTAKLADSKRIFTNHFTGQSALTYNKKECQAKGVFAGVNMVHCPALIQKLHTAP
jgi:hypothetical protein